MALETADIEFIKGHLGEWLAECSLGKPPAVYEIELRERMVRVEEELKHQRELIRSILVEMDKRFNAVDQRFEAVDRRFEAVDRRFEALHKQLDDRFEALRKEMDVRFEAMQKQLDERFMTAQKRLDERFLALNSRIDRFMIWSFGITLSTGALVVALIKLL